MREETKGGSQVDAATPEEALALEYQARSLRGLAWRLLALVHGQDDQLQELDPPRI